MAEQALRLISLTPDTCDSSEPIREAGVVLTVGRHFHCSLQVSSARAPVVSSRHCQVEFSLLRNRLVASVVDTSKNGTFVNGAQVKAPAPRLLSIGDTISLGSFAKVYRCVRRSDGAEFAVKKVSRTRIKFHAGRGAEAQLREEAAVLLGCTHPNVLRVVAFYEEKGFFFQVMELIRNGDLAGKMEDKSSIAESRQRAATAAAQAASTSKSPTAAAGSADAHASRAVAQLGGEASGLPASQGIGGAAAVAPFSEKQACQIFVHICEGLRYLHEEARVAHRDIKPQNILCSRLERPSSRGRPRNARWWFKLADGLFRSTRGAAGTDCGFRSVVGTDIFMAPEIVALRTAYASQSQPDEVEAAGPAAEAAAPAPEGEAESAHQLGRDGPAASTVDASAAAAAAPAPAKAPSRQQVVYGREVDLFSLGVTLHIILCGTHPFLPTRGVIPPQAVAQAKRAVRQALQRAAARRVVSSSTSSSGEAAALSHEADLVAGMAGADVLAQDDPEQLRALEASLGDDAASPGDAAATAAADAATDSASDPAGAGPRSSRWAPAMDGPTWAGVSAEARELVRALMDPDPTQRPSAEECLKHAWTAEEAGKQIRSVRPLTRPFATGVRATVDDLAARIAAAEATGGTLAYALLADEDCSTTPRAAGSASASEAAQAARRGAAAIANAAAMSASAASAASVARAQKRGLASAAGVASNSAPPGSGRTGARLVSAHRSSAPAAKRARPAPALPQN